VKPISHQVDAKVMFYKYLVFRGVLKAILMMLCFILTDALKLIYWHLVLNMVL